MNKTLIREKEKYRTTHPYTNVVSSSEKSVFKSFSLTFKTSFSYISNFLFTKKVFF